ncbi:MAG TPA: alpha-ketoglutarate-dependent dioxygenase AlkB [Caulobacteraceae bacterium]|nr:alpha-ketoglutarate-dependent dioxygenase AlkB [Caulobacteraceae bacterium]
MRSASETQGELFAPLPDSAEPAGFGYWPDVIDAAEEAALAARLADQPFKPFEFHGFLGNRRNVSFGLRYDYGKQAVAPAPALPDFLVTLRERVAGLTGVPPQAFVQSLINEYQPGAGIGWHRDKPQFGLVVGVSLLSPALLRFRRKAGAIWTRASAPLAPRSAYRLSGPARHEWEHSIIPAEALRYSITFRTLA